MLWTLKIAIIGSKLEKPKPILILPRKNYLLSLAWQKTSKIPGKN